MLKQCLLVLYCVTVFSPSILGFSRKITIGALFEEDDPAFETFNRSVNAVNRMRQYTDDFGKTVFLKNAHLVSKDVFEITGKTCSLLEYGVAAVFGPSDKQLSQHVQSICDSVAMPNIFVRWDVNPTNMNAFNLYPHLEAVSNLFVHLVTEYNWKAYTIIYENSESLVHANKLLKRWHAQEYAVRILHLGEGPNYREVLNRVKKTEHKNIVIDCSYEILENVLIQSQQVGILGDDYEVIVTNLDLFTLDLEPYQYSGVNFTGIRLVDVASPHSQSIFDVHLSDMESCDSLEKLRVGPALMYDSVQLFGRAFKRFRNGLKGNIKSLSCNGSDNWELGESLSNYIGTTEVRGLTGLVKLDSSGYRRDFELEILRLSPKGTKSIGTYNSTSGIKWKSEESASSSGTGDDLFNRTVKVLISLNDPYNMLKESTKMEIGNDRYEGFAIEIIHELSKILHFNYTFIETAPDYGTKGKDGKWTGMLGLIMEGEADLAITDLTITADRESAVDFSLPFMNLGISILYRKPTRAPPSLFGFLSPFSTEIWLYLGGSYIFVSLCLFVMGRMCPAEWNNPYPCIEEPEQLENQFTLKNAFWFTMGSIMQQGSEIAPVALSTRMLGSAWWFFCLIIVALYTANLAAFLVVVTPVKPINSAEDLAALNGEIKYGAKRGGSTFNFFKVSSYEPYAKMYQYMVDNEKDVMTNSNEEGVKKVRNINEKYAFLMESTTIDYIQERQCNLSMIGGLLDAKGYGIAMRKNSTYRHHINEAVLTLQETGVIPRLKNKWWKEKRDGGRCSKILDNGPANPLTLDNVGGVFLTLGIGVALAGAIAFWEFIWGIGSTSNRSDVQFKDEFMKEIRFVMKCKGTTKTTSKEQASMQTTETNTRASTPPYDVLSTITSTPGGNR